MSEAARPDEATARATHHAPVVRRPADHPGEAGRFANVTRMVFHPSPEHPNEPNAGTVTYEPGAGFALHMHDFAQLWYVLDGECRFGEHRLTAGDMVYMEDPHFEHEMHTDTGCTIVFMQYPGPTTGARPIYQGRFDGREAAEGVEPDLRR